MIGQRPRNVEFCGGWDVTKIQGSSYAPSKFWKQKTRGGRSCEAKAMTMLESLDLS